MLIESNTAKETGSLLYSLRARMVFAAGGGRYERSHSNEKTQSAELRLFLCQIRVCLEIHNLLDFTLQFLYSN